MDPGADAPLPAILTGFLTAAFTQASAQPAPANLKSAPCGDVAATECAGLENSLPFTFDRYRSAGMMTEQGLEAASSPGAPPVTLRDRISTQEGTYPLYLSVADFR